VAHHDPVMIDGKIDEPGPGIACRRQHRVVLNASEQDLVPPGRQHRVVPFRAAAGEDDLARPRTEEGCNLLARILHARARAPALGMWRGRVADDVERSKHRRLRLAPQRRRCVPVKICARPAHSLASPNGTERSDWLLRTACLAAGMPSITSCSVTLCRKAAI